jgi:hypothetical protein
MHRWADGQAMPITDGQPIPVGVGDPDAAGSNVTCELSAASMLGAWLKSTAVHCAEVGQAIPVKWPG